ncbi:MAG: exodeoxyribonuclease I [Candidatus Saccharibacteria bacterium]|nr:exodeoxyribonuclease I [Candidatus Saccharibacteria bacterium]
MKQTFFFYDLETSGLSSRYQRIMQFAGQRTDMALNPIGEPVDILVRVSEDILPDPQAILITGTTPQKTIEEGIGESEFCKMLINDIFTAGTIAVGFNSVRFDDEFVRHTLWRNFHDPYQWAWADQRSRWDILDVVRMTRALRPDGIQWPVDDDGAPTNRLELLSQANNLTHLHAHDALSDVEATIQVAKLIKQKQPKLFDFLLKMRDKKEVAKIVNLEEPEPFVYSSGRFGKANNFTTVALPIAPGSTPGSVLVYDLRYNPADFSKLSQSDIKAKLFASWEDRKKEGFQAIPVKELAYNKCPAVAPTSVLDDKAWERLNLSKADVEKHFKSLGKDFTDKVAAAYSEKEPYPGSSDVEGQLYDGFMNERDKVRTEVVRNATEKDLVDFHPEFADERLGELLLRYKARNYPKALSADEQEKWQEYRQKKFTAQAPQYMKSLSELSAKYQNDDEKSFLLQELQLWAEAHAPIE